MNMFESEPKLRFSTVDEAKQFLIEHYGLFLEGHTSYVFSVAITRDAKFIVSGSEESTVQV